MFRVVPSVKKYHWGKLGSQSLVAQLSRQYESVNIEENYAELWMGTHPSGMGQVIQSPGADPIPLDRFLQSEMKQAPSFPFLFKVLSIAKVLSIQAHPTAAHANELHRADPGHYPDPHHKPELLCALTPVEAFCGFYSAAQIQQFLDAVPPFRQCLEACGMDVSGPIDETFGRRALLAILRAPAERVAAAIDAVLALAPSLRGTGLDQPLLICERLQTQFPYDAGVLAAPFLLQYYQLAPGEALFLCPNIPHAYLSGDGVEIMACSDNVVRAGLTPKFKDVDTLSRMMDALPATQPNFFCEPEHPSPGVAIYRPPASEFELIRVTAAQTPVTVGPFPAASLCLALQPCRLALGNTEAEEVQAGEIMLIAPGSCVNCSCAPGEADLFFAKEGSA